jgi:hypothetical protein
MPTLYRSTLTLTGRVRIVTRSLDGDLLTDSGWIANQICNGGASAVVSWLCGVPNRGQASVAIPYPAYMELGDGSGTPAATDTDLFSPNTSTNVHVTQATPSASNPLIAEWTAVWGPQYGPYSATEIGLLSASRTLFSHLLATIDLTTTASTAVTWQWQLSV